jgi:L-seryl-tRNA(Ser) seleniumtransferase
MKVAKEEIVGLVTALEAFVQEDEAAEMASYQALAQRVVDAMTETPGLDVSLEHDGIDYLIPTAVLRFGKGWQGPPPPQVAAAMEQGDPPIYLHQLGPPDQLGVDPLNLTEGETDTIIRRLRETLSA